MNILHSAGIQELIEVVKEDIARMMVLARKGRLGIELGGGGTYGKIDT